MNKGLFHLGFLPTFFDLTVIGCLDALVIIAVFMTVLGMSFFCYAFTASRARRIFRSKRALKILNRTSGSLLIGTGIAVAARR